MYERFTDRARKVMQLANQEAQRFNHEYIGTEHILLGLIKEGSGVAANVLKNLNMDLNKIRSEVEKIVQAGPDMVSMGNLPQTPRAKKVIEYSIEEARSLNYNYVGTEHLLLGLLREAEGVGALVLVNLGLRLKDVRAEVLNLLGHNVRNDDPAGIANEAKPSSLGATLTKFGLDITEQAKAGKLRPVLGRQHEISRVIRVLSRRTKYCPLLLGDAGVGKTTLVCGVAERFAAGEVPLSLIDHRIIALDVALLVALAQDQEAYYETINSLVEELRQAPKMIVFLRDVHELFTVHKGHDALTLELARGEIQYIATTTTDNYYRHIAKDNGLSHSVTPIHIEPASAELTLEILRQIRPRYEEHHHVRITDEALQAVVEMAARELPEHCFPDKAIDVIDEAGALVRLRNIPRPLDLAEMDGRIERFIVDKEKAVAAGDYETAAHLRDQGDQLKKHKDAMLLQWKKQAKEVIGIVDEQVVAEVVKELAGPRPDPLDDIPF